MDTLDLIKSYRFPLILNFKGDRDYLHGSDIFNAILQIAQQRLDQEMWLRRIAFRGFARTSCDLVIGDVEHGERDFVRATCMLQHEGNKISCAIIETGKPVTGRYPFDELRITANSVFHGQGISQKTRAGFSPIEEIIAMTKYLHYRLLPIQSGKWIFSQLDLSQPFSEDTQVCYSVLLKQNLANRMTVSEVVQENETIGKIRFTVAQ